MLLYAKSCSRYWSSFIYIPLYFYLLSILAIHLQAFHLHLHSTSLLLYLPYGSTTVSISQIYISLCFYFIRGHSKRSFSDRCIYIPFCFYFIPCAGTTLTENENLSTFHFASTSSPVIKLFPIIYLLLYIPLCFYFIRNSWNSSSGISVSTFHYASTLSALAPVEAVPLADSTFHYASTLSARER